MNEPPLFNRVAIIGLGLMGGSLGLAIRSKQLAASVAGFARRQDTRNDALARGIVDQAFDKVENAVLDAELVVFCTPIGVMAELVEIAMPHFADACVITDVGSSKQEIVARLEPFFRKSRAYFVGGHPIAGSEMKGLKAAWPGLYENATVALTPTRRTNKTALKRVQAFWNGLNTRVEIVSPKEHDEFVARTSHLPHLVASMLASRIGDADMARVCRFCGTGFMDATRIAEGDPELWQDIVKSNSPAIARELKTFAQQVEQVRKLIANGDFPALRRFLEKAQSIRVGLHETSQTSS